MSEQQPPKQENRSLQSKDVSLKLDTDSKDIMSENLRSLKELFPSVIKDGTIDVEALKNIIGDISEPNTEYYNFTWAGKSDAFKIIKEKSKATLKPLKSDDESLNFENTGNIFIEGDNLEVLKILQKTYHNAIKMIYIDPPYNKDKDFVYPDRWSEGLESYLEYAKLVDEDGNITSSSAEEQSVKQGRKHSRWLTMMYPRLFLARNLLKDDGVIFISIDDDEFKNLKNITDEIFGEENFVANFIVVRSEGGGLAKQAVIGHDYLLCYTKNLQNFNPLKKPKDIRGKIVQIDNEDYWIEEDWLRKEFGKYGTCPYDEIEKYHSVEKKKEIDKGIDEGKYRLIDKNGVTIVGRLRKVSEDGSKFYTILKHLNKNGVDDLTQLELNTAFDFPKPTSLLHAIVQGATFGTQNSSEIILDFFAGSGTTAHAVMALNAEDGGNRKSISVQLPEHLDKKNQKEAISFLESIEKPTNIAEITKERIRRAGRKIKEENPDTTIDTGFKVFRLSESNFKKWDENIQTKEQLKVSLDLFVNNVKNGADSLDILYEVILSKGLSLNSKVDVVTIGGKSMYKVNSDGVEQSTIELLACFEDEITKDALEAVVSLRPIYFICLDSSFKSDTSLKTNSVLNFKDADILFETV
jgi:adenine-specific DNA-methyltransferase